VKTLGAEERGNNLIASGIRVRGMSHGGMYAFVVQLGRSPLILCVHICSVVLRTEVVVSAWIQNYVDGPCRNAPTGF
jgi:hypothetical protein